MFQANVRAEPFDILVSMKSRTLQEKGEQAGRAASHGPPYVSCLGEAVPTKRATAPLTPWRGLGPCNISTNLEQIYPLIALAFVHFSEASFPFRKQGLPFAKL